MGASEGGGLDVSLVGAPNETVRVCVARAAALPAALGDKAIACRAVRFGAGGGWRLVHFDA